MELVDNTAWIRQQVKLHNSYYCIFYSIIHNKFS
jgi:hypothetical protein